MPDHFPLNLFEQLYQRAPSREDRQRLLAVKAGLGLSERDELWPFILVLDGYVQRVLNAGGKFVTITNRLPERLDESMGKIEAAAATKADQAIARAVDRGIKELTQTVAKRSVDASERMSRQRLVYAGICGALLAVLLIIGGAVMAFVILDEMEGLCSTEAFDTGTGRRGCFVD